MEKTTVYLTAEQKAALARAAAAEGRSEARLIRAGIDVVTAAHQAAETVAASSRTPAGPAGTLPPGSEAPLRGGRPRWLPRDDFVRAIVRHQADPALGRELHELAPDTTDEARAR